VQGLLARFLFDVGGCVGLTRRHATGSGRPGAILRAMEGVGARFRDIRSGYAVAVLVFVLGVAGRQVMADLSGPPTRPYVAVVPGSTGRFCVSDVFDDRACQGEPEDPAFSVGAAMIWYRFDAPIKANAILDISYWRIEGDRERQVLDMPFGNIGDQRQEGFGPGSMSPSDVSGKPGTYDARATVDDVLVAQGLFTLVSP
jgi:hypothetical protein